MVPFIFHGIRVLFGSHLGIWTSQVHALTLSLLAMAWFWPLLTTLFKHLPKSEPEIEWIQLWRCPECSTYNRRAMTVCTHCEYHIQVGGMARWVPLKLAEFVKHNARRLVRMYQLAGWLLFYGSTLFAFWYLKLYSFRQNPIQELTACGSVVLLLVALMSFRLVLRPRFKSPMSALIDLVGGVVAGLILLFALFLWDKASSQVELAQWLRAGYDATLGRWHFLENKSFDIGAPMPPSPKPVKPPQKAARRRPYTG